MSNRNNQNEELNYLTQLNKHEDTLDVFVNLILKRSPTVFVLINMTLMIWLVQTIFSSNLESIPRSIYLLSPSFTDSPIYDVDVRVNGNCSDGYEQLYLKTFPTIKQQHIIHKKMTLWGDQGAKLCVRRLNKVPNLLQKCPENKTFCSGYCQERPQQCPITDVQKISITKNIPKHYEIFHTNQDYNFILSRKSSTRQMVSWLATYQSQCANDYKYYDRYSTFDQYWTQTKKCGGEGTLTTQIYKVVDHMSVSDFFLINNVNSPYVHQITSNQTISLGFLYQIRFKNNTQKCQKAHLLAKNLDNYLFEDPVKPSFTRGLLVVAFIFFTGCWAWLIGFYCFDGKRKQKNMIVILMVVVEIIVVAFTYSQNTLLFKTETVVQEISSCISNEFAAVSHWQFGIKNATPFIMIMFLCTSFLLLQLIAVFLDYCIYEPYPV